GNEMAHQFCSDVLRRRRMARKDVEHRQTIFDSTACGNLVTQNCLLAVIVRAVVEEERSCISTSCFSHHRIHCRATAARLEDGPTSKTTSYFLHVFLRVATLDAECVELHQLARVVFVDTTPLLLLRHSQPLHGVGTDALKVVEIKEH